MKEFKELCRHAPPDMPVGDLLRAWDRLTSAASVGDLMQLAGRLREQRQAPARERRVATPSTERHGQMLALALEPTVRYVRGRIFGKEEPPVRSAEALDALKKAEPKLLERLEPDAKQIADATGFQLGDVLTWLLFGDEPRAPWIVTLCPALKRLPDGRVMDATRMRIESSVPMTGESDIRKAVQAARKLWGTERIKSWAEEDVRLLRAVQQAGGAPKGDRMIERWREIAEQAELGTWRAAFDRWSRVEEKAARFGIPLDPEKGIDWWTVATEKMKRAFGDEKGDSQ